MIAIVLQRVTQLLAFFLPLKVLILTGSSEVPRYFPFIDPAFRSHWIAALSLSAFGAYSANLWLERWAGRLTEKGGQAVAKQATPLCVINRQEERARRYYADFTTLAADIVLIAVAGLALALLQPFLLLVLVLLFAAEFTLAARILAAHEGGWWVKSRAKILADPKTAVETASAVNFFFGFLVLLCGLLLASAEAFLATVLGFLILRQLLRSLRGAIRSTIQLTRDRQRIDPIFRPEQRWQPAENMDTQALRKHFHQPRRQEQTAQVLERALGNPHHSWVIRWEDPLPRQPFHALSAVPAYTDFTHRSRLGCGPKRYQQQIFTPHSRQLLQDEELLFQYVDRDALRAVHVLVEFEQNGFLCRVCESGLGRPPRTSEWRAWHPRMIRERWTLSPPQELIRAYKSARYTLDERLTEELLKPLEVAIDSQDEASIYEQLQALLPDIRDSVGQLPLSIYPSGLDRTMAIMTATHGPRITTWGKWRVEPIGGGLKDNLNAGELASVLAEMPKKRGDCSAPPPITGVRLARAARLLEDRIVNLRYKQALHIAAHLMQHVQR
ncbi:hypothetical protein [Halorhodospira sp. 9622]|uniref:hypothetical protein n=1 Tax=Halorhodospira sp. 9622 TaxID=2899136 RepID=UPI001EE7F17A|nr:hypothetical protein [Halorhodospira sp. 9622]MCG5538606.1 hypothetical protein [Halorhodospira sp. 9622]